jgi:uncharacterized LabA/DUF88 family protein
MLGFGLRLGLGGQTRIQKGNVELPVIYKLIDGAFFRRLLDEYSKLIGQNVFENLDWPVFLNSVHRCIYYDALPVKKTEHNDEEFSSIEAEKEKFFDFMRSIPNVHVTDGLTKVRTKRKGQKISEVYEQKGVDTWIAVDAVKLAVAGLADEVHIYTSDSDLYPVFEALRETRCRGILWYEEGRTSRELIYSADVAQPITISSVLRWCNGSVPFSAGSLSSVEIAGAVLFEKSANFRVFKFLFEEGKFHANIFNGSNYITTASSESPLTLVDALVGRGLRISYSEIQALFGKALVKR